MILGDFSLFCEGSNEMNKVIYWVLAMAAACGNSRACEGDAAQWGREFVALRSVRGHFDGGAWTADVDRWQGRKHLLMQCLAAGLSAPGTPIERVVEWMGEPDSRVACDAGACTRWAYHWRGVHDRLVFSVERGKITGVAWDYALE